MDFVCCFKECFGLNLDQRGHSSQKGRPCPAPPGSCALHALSHFWKGFSDKPSGGSTAPLPTGQAHNQMPEPADLLHQILNSVL